MFSSSRIEVFMFCPPPGLDNLHDWTNNVQPYFPIYVARRDFEFQGPVLLLLLQ
ncbi:hypothetical protein SLEP1_g13471 [Rubroshorea leprosula]|uniref:Uncharacterized protein n=1 Tax=Rubroshorea leprosula TaxID=152421 RepID=A0AAV5IQG7_9ROSI|nr:hypothetical protein SLEP1_g13471 [Rubroshorea leprosula]